MVSSTSARLSVCQLPRPTFGKGSSKVKMYGLARRRGNIRSVQIADVPNPDGNNARIERAQDFIHDPYPVNR
jgi:hypothetical protein